jgi:hypothetical protein
MTDWRLACTFRELDSKEGYQGNIVGSIDDQWGFAPRYFPTTSLPREKVVKGGTLRQMRSTPFFSREARTTNNEPPVASTSSRPSTTTRHIRKKSSKVAQIPGIAGASEEAKDCANVAHPPPNYGGTTPSLILPMDFDPSYGGPLGAVTVGDGLSASQMQRSRPALSVPSASVPTERRPTHAHTRNTSMSQSTNGFSQDTAAERAPRSQFRVDAKADTLSARSRSHSHLPPSSSAGQHGSASTHAKYPVDAFAPHVRSATATTNKRHQDTYSAAPKQVPHLRKARSSVILSNAPPPPLYAPKPLNFLERPRAETLHALAESASMKPSHSNAQSAVATGNAVWPPSPVVPPLWNVMPPRVEQDSHRAAAIEANKAFRKIGHERAPAEHIRGDHGLEVHRAEQGSRRPRHHRRAATENVRRPAREGGYHSLADNGYYNVDQQWAGVTR